VPIIIGVDAHKKTHTAVAVDRVTGQQIDEITVAARVKGFERLVAWARRLDADRTFAIEDCRHVSGGLERYLIPAGERSVRVPTKLMAESRRVGRERGKSDPIDALAAARAAIREPDLPAAQIDGPERDLRLLVDHRETLVCQRSETQSKLRWLLHELDPEFEIPLRTLDRIVVLDRVATRLAEMPLDVRVEICIELLAAIRALTIRVNAFEARIKAMAQQLAPGLLTLPGCGALTAAKIIGETAGVNRFASEAKFAMHAGIAPLPVWSGAKTRFRLNRSGNRQLNTAIHRIAVTQMRIHQPAKDFIARKMSEGKTKTEALRSLKRHIARKVYDAMTKHQIKTPADLQPAAA
jgi:transposase